MESAEWEVNASCNPYHWVWGKEQGREFFSGISLSHSLASFPCYVAKWEELVHWAPMHASKAKSWQASAGLLGETCPISISSLSRRFGGNRQGTTEIENISHAKKMLTGTAGCWVREAASEAPFVPPIWPQFIKVEKAEGDLGLLRCSKHKK